ncbi:MAG: glutaredoxin family protein [Candidatus Woesearchaeota archaeon]
MAKKPNVILYGTEKCVWSEKIQHFLEVEGITITFKNITKDPSAYHEMASLTQQFSLPVVALDKKYVVGYNLAEIRKLFV